MRHIGEVLRGADAREVVEQNCQPGDEGYPYTAVAACTCGWWQPAVHGQEAEEKLANHVRANTRHRDRVH